MGGRGRERGRRKGDGRNEGRWNGEGGREEERIEYSTHKTIPSVLSCTHMYGLTVWQSEEIVWGMNLFSYGPAHTTEGEKERVNREGGMGDRRERETEAQMEGEGWG